MFQRLSVALAQVKRSNTSEYLLNKATQTMYSLHYAKKKY